MSDDDPAGSSPAGTRPSGVVAASADPGARSRRWPRWPGTLVLAVLTVLLAVAVRALLVEVFYIPSGSMEPGLHVGDRIVVEKVSSAASEPRRGDVVVFEDPGGWLEATEQSTHPVAVGLQALGVLPSTGRLVKRVVGVAGDVVRCCDEQGRLVVNDVSVEEDYLEPGAPCAGPMIAGCRWRAGPVPEGRLFVMGDHRAASGDSTTHQCTDQVTECTNDPYVDTSLVVGRVWALVRPWSRVGLVPDERASFDAVPAGS